MKKAYAFFYLCFNFMIGWCQPAEPATQRNLIILTTDGFRWQELFGGADPAILNDPKQTPDAATIKLLYDASTANERRQKLMPFCWSVIAQQGQLYGNRHFNNYLNVANAYAISYPGYNEMLTGTTDIRISSNRKKENPNLNILEILAANTPWQNQVAIFSSWNVMPFILNQSRNQLPVNAGYQSIADSNLSTVQQMLNWVQDNAVVAKGATRMDALTYVAAREYLQQHHPKIAYISLGETDEFAHAGRYDLYLQQAANVDKMIAELWHWIQTTPGYANNTNLLITTDHGRGKRAGNWSRHSLLTGGSSQTWLALLGPDIQPLGEIKTSQQLFQQQIAPTIAQLAGTSMPNIAVMPIPYDSGK